MAPRSTSHSPELKTWLLPFKPPRNLREAVEAAWEVAEAEVLHYLPNGTSGAVCEQTVAGGSAFESAQSVASLILSDFLLSDEADEVAAGIAETAVNRRIRALPAVVPNCCMISATVAIPDAIITLTPEIPSVTVKPIVEKQQDSEQRVALGKAIDAAFASACEMYGCIEIPEGIPFEDLPQEEHDRCVRRGRLDAFSILEPILTWDAAVRMAELLAEAAWQIRARELATPPSAFKVRL